MKVSEYKSSYNRQSVSRYPLREIPAYEEEAKAQFGTRLYGEAASLANDLRQAEIADQLSEYRTQKQELFNKYMMDMQSTPDAPDWDSETQTMPELDRRITQWQGEEGIFAGITNSTALKAVQQDFQESIPKLKNEALKYAFVQDARLKETSYLERRKANTTWPDREVSEKEALEMAIVAREDNANAEKNSLAGMGNPDYAQRIIAEDSKKILSNYVIQESIKSGKFIDTKELQEKFGVEYSAEEKAELKEEYQIQKDAQERKNEKELKALQEKTATDLYLQIISGELTNPQIITQALESDSITRGVHKELSNLMGVGTSNENDPMALAEMYQTMMSDMSSQEKFEKLISLTPKLKGTTVDGFIKEIYKPEETNLLTRTHPLVEYYTDAIDAMFLGGEGDKELSPIESQKYMDIRYRVEQRARELLPQEGGAGKLQKEIENLTKPIKEEKAKGLLWELFHPFSQPSIKELNKRGYKGSLREMTYQYRLDEKTKVIDVKTIEEARNLPSGTKFRYNGEVRVRN